MDQLQWTRRETGWRAGRYRIELLAPGFWVLSRLHPSRDEPHIEILESSGYRSALVATATELEKKRVRRRKAGLWAAVVGASFAALIAAYLAALPWTPAVVVGSSCLAVFASIQVMNGVVERSWESIKNDYQ